MKKFLFALCCLSFMFAAQVALADAAPDFGKALLDTVSAIKVGSIGAILIAVGQLLKSDFISNLISAKINTKYLPWISTALGVIISVGQSLIAGNGKPVWVNILEGVIASVAAAGLFDHTKAATQQA